MRILKQSLAPFLLCSLFAPLVHAQNFWVGDASGSANDWGVSSNWSLGHIPGNGENVAFDSAHPLNQSIRVPASMVISTNHLVRNLSFSNGFNPSNSTVIGSSSATARIITFENNAVFFNNASSGSVTFQPFNGGAGALSLRLNGFAEVASAPGSFLNLLVSIADGTGPGSIAVGNGPGTVVFGAANTYSGGTVVVAGFLQGTHDRAFGTGSLTLNGGPIVLTLSGGATNNYIADNAVMSIALSSTVNLNYIGTDIVGALVIEGVQQLPGVYSSANVSEFHGTGTITVIPEPTTWAMFAVGAVVLLAFRRRVSVRSQ